MEWLVSRLMRNVIPYASYVTEHFLGAITTVEYVGVISDEAARAILAKVGVPVVNGQAFIPQEDIPAIPLEALEEDDREVMERALKVKKGFELLGITLRALSRGRARAEGRSSRVAHYRP